MGLDIVELVMEIEEEFDIRIPDDEAAQIMTLAHLHSFIHAQLRGRTNMDYCPSSRAFYRLRRVLTGEFGISRQSVTTRACMEGLLARDGRQRHWARLGRLLGGWEMPPLRRPDWAVRAMLLSGFGVVVSAMSCVVMIMANGPTWAPASALLLCAALLGLAFRGTESFAIELPPSCMSVRGTVQSLLRTNYGRLVTETGEDHGRLVREAGGLQQDEVWQRMCKIISKQLGVGLDKLTPDTRFTDDLGAD
jgi:acyl carrier protein